MADKIVVMHDGIVEQIGAPLELYDRPANLFVAGFIGSPAMNFLKGQAPTARASSPPAVRLPLPRRKPATEGGARSSTASGPSISRSPPMTAPRPRSSWSSRPARRRRSSPSSAARRSSPCSASGIDSSPGERSGCARSAARSSLRRPTIGQPNGNVKIITTRRKSDMTAARIHPPRRDETGAALAARRRARRPDLARCSPRPGRRPRPGSREGAQAPDAALEALRAVRGRRRFVALVAAFTKATGVEGQRSPANRSRTCSRRPRSPPIPARARPVLGPLLAAAPVPAGAST